MAERCTSSFEVNSVALLRGCFTNKYFELIKLVGRWGTPELELLAGNFPVYVQ